MTEERALHLANAALFDMIGNPDWDKPCLAKHILAAVAEEREASNRLRAKALAIERALSRQVRKLQDYKE